MKSLLTKFMKQILILAVFLISIPVAEAAIGNATLKVIPRVLPLAVSLGTSTLQVEPGETLNINAYVRNAYNQSMKDVRVWFVNATNCTITIKPDSIDELKPDEIRAFSVNFSIPADMKEGEYVMVLEGGSKDFSDPIMDTIVLRISKITNEIYYATAFACLLIIVLFMWRRIKYNRKKKG